MKSFCKVFALPIFLLSFYTSNAQQYQPKAKLFNSFENVLPCKTSELEKGFLFEAGKPITLSLGKNLSLKGYITSSIQRYHNLKSLIIKLTDFNGAILSISKRINTNNTVIYTGRIISENYADGYELKTDIAGNYFLNKIKTEDLIQDHE